MHHAESGTLQRGLSRWPWGDVGWPWGKQRRRALPGWAGFHLPAAAELEEEEEEEEESLGCPRKLKSSGSRLACSPMPGRGTRGWVSPGSDAAPRVGPLLRGRQLQRWVVAVGSPSWAQASWGAQGPLLQGQTDRQHQGAIPSGARKLGGRLCPLPPCLDLSPGMRTSPRVPPQWLPFIEGGRRMEPGTVPGTLPFAPLPPPQFETWRLGTAGSR